MQLACNTGTTLSRHLVSSSTIWSYLAWNKNNLVNSTETIISICEIICLGLSPNLSSCQVQRPYIISTTHCLNQTQIFAQIRIVIYKQPKTLGNHTARHSLSHALILLNIHISGVESKTSIWQRRQKQQFIQTVFFFLSTQLTRMPSSSVCLQWKYPITRDSQCVSVWARSTMFIVLLLVNLHSTEAECC